jgi:hypothetical protein
LPKERTFATKTTAFSLKPQVNSLTYHYEEFSNEIEIVNHDCLDFVFYQKGPELEVLSLLDSNDIFILKLDRLTLKENALLLPTPKKVAGQLRDSQECTIQNSEGNDVKVVAVSNTVFY